MWITILLIVVVACFIAVYSSQVKEIIQLKDDRDVSSLKYEQLRQKHEFDMDVVLCHSRHIAFTVNAVKVVRDGGRRPKWTVYDIQDLIGRAELLMKLVEDNVTEKN